VRIHPMPIARQMVLQVAARNIGQVTDMQRASSPARGGRHGRCSVTVVAV
jgi:hypothetical protein